VRRGSRLRRGEITITALAWLGVFVVMVALAVAGVSDAFVYGTYPATVPLMLSGVAWAGFMAARANWHACGSGIAVAVVGLLGGP
jgi:hypothetical protein